MHIETACENVRTMDESVKPYALPDKHNEEYFEAELIPEKILMLLKICIQKHVIIRGK